MLDWLDIARNQAEERFRSLPAPTAKDENFRFTSLSLPEEGKTTGSETAVPAELSRLDEEEGALLSLTGEEAHFSGELPGAMLTDLMRAAVLGIDFVRGRLKDPTLFPQDKFAQLTAARWKNGAFFQVPAGVKLPKPVRIATFAGFSDDHFRHLVTLEEGAEATLVLESSSAENLEFVTELLDLRLGKGAKLHLVILQRFSNETKGAIRQRLDLGEEAELKITPLHLGGSVVQVRQECKLGEESSLELLGAARGSGSQQFDFWLDMDHIGSRSKSQVDFHFVMGGSSKAVFNGLIHIRKDAFDCNAGQKAKSLLLGQKATVHAIPKLIIQTDQVKCSHGASVSSVNPEQIHYLQSRGIPKRDAERMIVRGFTEPVLEQFPTDSLQGRADAALDQKEGGWLQ